MIGAYECDTEGGCVLRDSVSDATVAGGVGSVTEYLETIGSFTRGVIYSTQSALATMGRPAMRLVVYAGFNWVKLWETTCRWVLTIVVIADRRGLCYHVEVGPFLQRHQEEADQVGLNIHGR